MIAHPEPDEPDGTERGTHGDLPSFLTLTVFFRPETCSDADVASGRAHLRAARALLMRIVREHALLRHARTTGIRLSFDDPVLTGRQPPDRFDHVVCRLDGSVARGEPGRFQADFYLGVDAVAAVSIDVRTGATSNGVV